MLRRNSEKMVKIGGLAVGLNVTYKMDLMSHAFVGKSIYSGLYNITNFLKFQLRRKVMKENVRQGRCFA